MRTKSRILVLVLIALFLISTISALADDRAEVDLTATVTSDRAEVDLTATVIAPPVANAGGPYSCNRYATLLLDGSGSYDPDGSIVSYLWDFGDGTTGTGVKPSHVYSSTGIFTITLTVTDNDGLTDSDSTTVTVVSPPSPPTPPGPLPLPNKNPKSDAGLNMKISVGSTLYFSGADSYDPDGTIVAYRWDFGDGTTATGVKVYHTYSEPGHYTVTLVVMDDRGAEDSDKCKVFVWKPPAPVADKFGQLVPGYQKGFKVNALEAAKTTVTLNTTKPITVTILRYEVNPHPDDPIPEFTLPIYIDIEISNSTAVEWPIYVEVHYIDEMVEGLDESLLGIYYWKDGVWHRCSDTGVDTERNVIWAYMTAEEVSGSPILVGYTPPKPAKFTVSNLTITPAEVEPGELVTISVLVTNVGEEKGTCTVTLKVEGELTTREITLEGGESKKLEFKVIRETEGTYNVEIDGLSGTFEVKVPTKPRPAEFIVSGLTLTPAESEEFTKVEVRFTVTNVGEEKGTYTVNLYVDGAMVQSTTVTLEGGTAKTLTLTLTEPTGSHTVRVDGLTGSFKVLPKTIPFWRNLYYIVGILILAAGVTLYILYRRGLLPLPNSTPGARNQ